MSRYRERYWIWAVHPQNSSVVLCAGLGYRRHALARWKELTHDEKKIPLRTHILLSKLGIAPRYFKVMKHSSYETRAEARAVLLNLRMQNPNAVIEDWLP